jgi:hypothetical protein
VERKAQEKAAVGRESIGPVTMGAQRPGRLSEDVAAGAVELPEAAVTSRKGDLGDGEIRVVEQAARKMRPRRTRESVGRYPEVGGEEASQVSFGHTQPCA